MHAANEGTDLARNEFEPSAAQLAFRPARSRRWPQFSLLGLMAFVTVVSAVLSLGMAFGPAWRGGVLFWGGAAAFLAAGAKGRPGLMTLSLVASAIGICWAARSAN